jgi:hypothetical protein
MFSMPVFGITAMPFASGAADAAVANNAEAPSASETIALFILNSSELMFCEPSVETTNRSSKSALDRFANGLPTPRRAIPIGSSGSSSGSFG